MTSKLFTFRGNLLAHRIMITASFVGEQIDVVSEPPDFAFGMTNKSPLFLEKFPFGRVPALETSNGLCLHEATPIIYYLAALKPSAGLLGYDSDSGNDPSATAAVAAQVFQYIIVAEKEVEPSVSSWYYPLVGIVAPCRAAIDKARNDVFKLLHVLDHILDHERSYLVGNGMTLADITMVSVLLPLFRHLLSPDDRDRYPQLTRWFKSLVELPEFLSVLGVVKFCDVPLTMNFKLDIPQEHRRISLTRTRGRTLPMKSDRVQSVPDIMTTLHRECND